MELGDMLKKGEVMAADVLPKFAIAYEQAIGADQVQRVETLAAAENRAKNKWTDFVDSLNEGQGVITKTGISFFNLTSDILDLLGAKEKLSKEIENEQLQLNILIGKITSANIKEEERLKLIEELKRNYPDYISLIQDEDYSNQNLIKTLQKVNNEYRERIRLQVQNEKIVDLAKQRDDKVRISEESRLELMEKLIVLNEKYQLGFNITRDNAVEMSSEVIKSLEKVEDKLKLGDAIGYLTGNQRIKTLAGRVEIFEKSVEEANEELRKQQTIYEDINKADENREYSLRNQISSIKSYNDKLEEALQKAVKLGGIAGKDFSDMNLESVNSYISKQSKGGESEAEAKKREAAERKAKAAREKALREAEKLEDQRLKKQKEIYEAEIDLLIFKTQSEAEILKAESTNEKNTTDERYDALMKSFQLEENLIRLNTEKQLKLARAFQKDKVSLTDQEIQDLINGVQIKTELSNEELLILEKLHYSQEKLRKSNQKSLEDNAKFEADLIKKQIQEKVKDSNSKNFNDESGEINALSIGNNLTDVESYEKAVYEIKRKYLLKNLEDELAVYNQIIENEKSKGTVTQEMLDKQLELGNSVREFNNQTHIESLEKAKELEEKFIEMGMNIKNALVDLTNAIFDNRIQRIDEDIERSDEYYENQIELYEGDAERQKLLREEQERAREKLEAKKRKEQHKQAVFNKAMAVADIGMSTAQAIMNIWRDVPKVDFGASATTLSVMAGILGAIQTATVLATPIPKYKTGRKGGPEEIAIVGDGGVHEVIEHKDGSAELTPKRDTLVKLLEGDTVHASLDLYRKSRRNKINNDIYKDKLTFEAYHSLATNDYSKLEDKLDTLIDVFKRKNMSTTVNIPKFDLGHQFWLEKQKNW